MAATTTKTALELWGHPVSQPTRAVFWFMLINGIPYKFKKFDPLSGETKTPEFLRVNPAGTVPVLLDYESGDSTSPTKEPFAIYESVAILTYLVGKHPSLSHWYPATPLTLRAKIDQYLHWHHSNTRQASHALFRPVLVAKLSGGDETALKTAKDKGTKVVSRFMKVIENGFVPDDERLFLCGAPEPTIADLTCYCELDQLEILNLFNFSDYPKVSRWMARLKQFPKYDESHKGLFSLKSMIEKGPNSKL